MQQRADTTHAFDGLADAYARARFDYSTQAIDAIVAVAQLDRSSAIADLGAGTGMLARHFTDRVGRIYAIEPNDEMRTLAHAALGTVESLRVLNGTAESTGLPDQSIDAVTAGRALRWFDPASARAEIMRILKPGGWLIVLKTPAKDAYSTAALAHLRASSGTQVRGAHRPQVTDHVYFGEEFVHMTFPCATRETWSQFIERLRSYAIAPPPGDPRCREIENAARAIFDHGAQRGVLHVRYATEVLMKQMLPSASPPP